MPTGNHNDRMGTRYLGSTLANHFGNASSRAHAQVILLTLAREAITTQKVIITRKATMAVPARVECVTVMQSGMTGYPDSRIVERESEEPIA